MESFNRIKDYLLHRLPDKERAQFEAEVRANEALARELELQRFEMETIDQIEADQLREKAAELRQQRQQRLEQNTQGSRSGSMVRMYRIIAAAAVVLLAIGFFFGNKKACIAKSPFLSTRRLE